MVHNDPRGLKRASRPGSGAHPCRDENGVLGEESEGLVEAPSGGLTGPEGHAVRRLADGDRPHLLVSAHVDDGHVHCEGGCDPFELDRLESLGYELIRWRRQNLYFGGASAVERRDDDSLAAAGDPRRGGHGIVVPR